MSNKILSGKSNKSLLPDFGQNCDRYLAIALSVISAIQMY